MEHTCSQLLKTIIARELNKFLDRQICVSYNIQSTYCRNIIKGLSWSLKQP